MQQGAQDSGDEVWDEPHWTEELEDYLDEEEDDSLENEDLTFITSVLDSLSNTKSGAPRLNQAGCEILTPEGATARAQAQHMTRQKFNQIFNQKFNQNLMIKSSMTDLFSCYPTILEEGTSVLSDGEDILSESEEEEFEFKTHSEVDTEEAEDETTFTSFTSLFSVLFSLFKFCL